ncbi:MAG: putative amino-acid metabolite efflux pump [Candidatus Ordinivivax streblomastigis]|uniref:Putative amino-acid metabolite efflux pump n=1 Tax=Candidatus Ordinivivax streblomastigis TaxID=2540710 RepID=A0A5M8P0W1_9BACT|nr:MAG: putative amino-acid metabolite efflux pump [Candidatus Ordinivivax streblomastigis]
MEIETKRLPAGKPWMYHLVAIFCVIIWGTTFVSTKILLNHGLTPTAIFFYRFLIAYTVIFFFSPKRLWAGNIKDEALFLCLGLTGGSWYYLTENTALEYTVISNVALIVCTAPLLTAFLSHWFVRGERLRKPVVYGSLLALLGVAFVIFNGHVILKTNPLGDLLSISAALLWAIYTIVLKRLDNRYSILFITRKTFFYGLLSILPSLYFAPLETDTDVLFQPEVIGNLLFLGLLASMLCYALWNRTIYYLGAVRTSNYIYFNPIVALITSAIVIQETITPMALLGAVMVLAGVYWAGKRSIKI